MIGEKKSGSNSKKLKPKTPKKKKKLPISIWSMLSKLFVVFVIWGICFFCLAIIWFSYDLPDVKKLQESSRKPSVTVLTTDGKELAAYGDLYEEFVKVGELPVHVPQAIMAVEDRRFYNHFGIDFFGLFRAAYQNYKAGRIVQGGSTLTQQLSKNFLLSQGLYKTTDRSFRRKIQEVLMSLWLEYSFTKEQILTIYLNRVYLGASTYGIDAAARKYFNKSAKNLNVYESALIAGLLKAPSRYSPLASPERAHKRAKVVLQLMLEAGYISDLKNPLETGAKIIQTIKKENLQGSRYFADWVYDQVGDYVNIDRDLIVVSTLDLDMQEKAEKSVEEKLNELGEQLKVKQMALVAMTPDGGVKAMVGGTNYYQSQFNRALALRQAGSTFKLFIYLAALEADLTPATMISDAPITIKNWSPKNFRLYIEKGMIALQDSYAYSVNTSTVRLALHVGIPKIIDVARRLGINTTLENNLSVALGAAEVSLLELSAAYSTFPNNGYSVWPYGILEIRDKEGNILYQRTKQKSNKIVAPEQVQQVNQIGGAAYEYGTGRNTKFGHPACSKSGSNADRDAWFIVYNRDLTVGVWAGNDNNEPMAKRSTGALLPGRTASIFMKKVFENRAPKPFHPLSKDKVTNEELDEIITQSAENLNEDLGLDSKKEDISENDGEGQLDDLISQNADDAA